MISQGESFASSEAFAPTVTFRLRGDGGSVEKLPCAASKFDIHLTCCANTQRGSERARVFFEAVYSQTGERKVFTGENDALRVTGRIFRWDAKPDSTFP